MIRRMVGALDVPFLGNSLGEYGTSVGLFVAAWAAAWAVKSIAVSRLRELAKKTPGDFDDFLIEELDRLRFWFYGSLSLFFSTRHLALPPAWHKGLRYFLVIAFAAHAIRFLQNLVSYAIRKAYARQAPAGGPNQATVKTIQGVARWVLWSGGLVFVLDNLGFNITAAVAGLGIGGVAVALAAQAILGDLFSAFSIFIDKPFEIGDTIVVGEMRGVVERIGLKTTRVRSIDGEQLIFSNADLTSSRIRNFKQMTERRVIFRLGFTYQTPSARLRRIPDLLREIVGATADVSFERAHFVSYGDSALVFEVAYRVLSPDMLVYLEAQQAIHFAIKERFDAEKIEFAYPTQTLFVVKP